MRRGRLDHRSGRGESGNQTEIAGSRRPIPQARRHCYHEHVRIAGALDRRGHERRISAALGRDAFLQSAPLFEIGRSDSWAENSKDGVETLSEFCDRRLGKGVVVAKYTPNFIANRIGTFSMLNALRLRGTLGMTVEEVD